MGCTVLLACIYVRGCTVLLVFMWDKWCTENFTRIFVVGPKVATLIETLYALS